MIHTQEPWEIQKGNIGPYIMAKDGNGGTVTIAQVFQRGIANCETDGNARLMKAAPKMYGVLNSLEQYARRSGETIPYIDDVLKILAEVEGKEGEDGS